jgi:6-phospho-3-hexuloisomerase
MRLMHLGLPVYVVGETITPNITQADMLLIGSGSGSTGSLVVMAQRAQAIGAKIGLITILEKSPIGQIADIVLTVPAPSSKIEAELEFQSVQPMGSLFEQSLALTLDALILTMMSTTDIDADTMFTRHANLE